MKCADCQEMFPLTELRFKPDGMVPGTHIKAHRAQCHKCAQKIPIDETSKKEYPF